MMSEPYELTPYDRGVVAQPYIWDTAERESYGKVDFDDDEGATLITAQMVKNAEGEWTLEVTRHSTQPLTVKLLN